MKAKLSQPYDALSGKNDTLVNYSLSGNPVVRRFVTPTNPQSEIQTTLRNYFTLASQGFSLLTDNERAAWKAVADMIARTNSLGQTYVVSDKGLYVMVNQYRQIDGQAITDTAPSLSSGAAPSLISTVKTDGGDLEITMTHAASDGFWLIENSAPLPGLQRQARENELYFSSTTLANNIVAVSSSPQQIIIPSDETKFTIATGNRIKVRITRLTAGYIKGAFLDWTGTVAAV